MLVNTLKEILLLPLRVGGGNTTCPGGHMESLLSEGLNCMLMYQKHSLVALCWGAREREKESARESERERDGERE